jgi:hypothetical protein
MPGPGLVKYDAARAALAVARRVDEVMKVRDEAQRLKLYARQAHNKGMIADAAELQLNVERRLGAMLVKAKASGQVAKGRAWPGKNNGQATRPLSRVARRGRSPKNRSRYRRGFPAEAFDRRRDPSRKQKRFQRGSVLTREFRKPEPSALAPRKHRGSTRAEFRR